MTGGVKSVSTRCENFVKKPAQQASVNSYLENDMSARAGTAAAGLLVTLGELFQILTIAFFRKFFFWNESQ